MKEIREKVTLLQKKRPLILLGLNELNFDYIEHYIEKGHLTFFKELLANHPLITTSSEKSYTELEPWIQWVSIQTGKNYSEHGVFRLGDIANKQFIQIWEHIESKHNVKVAALSPMNAANYAKDPAFFIPDPWTKTKISGSWLMCKIADSIANAVNENATGGTSLSTYVYLFLGVVRYSLLSRNIQVIKLILKSLRSHYHRVILLDQILTDIFCAHWKKDDIGFSTLFLNGGAHLQHHYLYNSTAYQGENENPKWYMSKDKDPLLECLKSYDALAQQILELPGKPRVMIATGLHQRPVKRPVFYWRLKDHKKFLETISAPFQSVHARMSRDFLIEFKSENDCIYTQEKLKSCKDENGIAFFEEIENRGSSLFVSLTYPHEIFNDTVLNYVDGKIEKFRELVGFVAIKNGEHVGEGYFIDNDGNLDKSIPLPITDIFSMIDQHFQLI